MSVEPHSATRPGAERQERAQSGMALRQPSGEGGAPQGRPCGAPSRTGTPPNLGRGGGAASRACAGTRSSISVCTQRVLTSCGPSRPIGDNIYCCRTRQTLELGYSSLSVFRAYAIQTLWYSSLSVFRDPPTSPNHSMVRGAHARSSARTTGATGSQHNTPSVTRTHMCGTCMM